MTFHLLLGEFYERQLVFINNVRKVVVAIIEGLDQKQGPWLIYNAKIYPRG